MFATTHLGGKSLLLLGLLLLQCHWGITAGRAEAADSESLTEYVSFELLIHRADVTAVFNGKQRIGGDHDTGLDPSTDSIAKGVHSLAFFFEGDSQGYPIPLQDSTIGSDGFSLLNVFAIDGFAVFPQEAKSRWAVVDLSRLREFLRGQQPAPDQIVDDLQHYISTELSGSRFKSVEFTLRLHYPLATAVFRGYAAGTFPLSLGTESLSFLLPNTDEAIRFRPTGTLYPSDWAFGLVSPDHNHLLLLQDHYGPYHIISFAHLAQYLDGHGEPDYLVDWQFPESSADAVLSQGRWLTNDLISFSAECCGTKAALIYKLGSDRGPVLHHTDD
ncbi:MAG TPA: hypothetical protein DG761_11145 [Gammaproteobacteria bacterium]|jgi:hypothetical protein|nr:hypothetical protein [Arenicellales bacterium]MDP7064432.1 hypothetical protein [Arenicellales bacterium]HCX88569.1 hypothetical protein [Gammaproteobacteria bacterium]|tara:strand:- start:28309 stop:29298 length:990 start_codon:yes stop_codon:yes gene_type:complete